MSLLSVGVDTSRLTDALTAMDSRVTVLESGHMKFGSNLERIVGRLDAVRDLQDRLQTQLTQTNERISAFICAMATKEELADAVHDISQKTGSDWGTQERINLLGVEIKEVRKFSQKTCGLLGLSPSIVRRLEELSGPELESEVDDLPPFRRARDAADERCDSFCRRLTLQEQKLTAAATAAAVSQLSNEQRRARGEARAQADSLSRRMVVLEQICSAASGALDMYSGCATKSELLSTETNSFRDLADLRREVEGLKAELDRRADDSVELRAQLETLKVDQKYPGAPAGSAARRIRATVRRKPQQQRQQYQQAQAANPAPTQASSIRAMIPAPVTTVTIAETAPEVSGVVVPCGADGGKHGLSVSTFDVSGHMSFEAAQHTGVERVSPSVQISPGPASPSEVTGRSPLRSLHIRSPAHHALKRESPASKPAGRAVKRGVLIGWSSPKPAYQETRIVRSTQPHDS
eukprot:TRINITY_DN12270_c1_g1_i1.p1 TRINITY_DN12270_c1_g1~~TRINITY_DN12270_c1_g1_i1.p1  ORF type:complete len:490 (+),score=144.49 TRINITY_DN12270_c1_g1_i1:79-1470(+)